MNKKQFTFEASLILSQEVNKFRLSKQNNKFSNQQVEYAMKRLTERLINLYQE